MKNELRPSEKAFELIRSFEGFRARAYIASKGEKYYTIGYGHCGKDVKKGETISVERAEQLMREDVNSYATMLAKQLTWLSQRQFDALCSMIYNIGWYNFRYNVIFFYFRDYPLKSELDCARQMTHWVRAGDKILVGLQIRRVKEANYFLGEERFMYKNGVINEIAL